MLGKAFEFLMTDRLRKIGYLVLMNVAIPNSRGTVTQIDIVAFGQAQILVFEVKDYNAWIYPTKGMYWKAKYNSGVYPFFNPINQNKVHIKELEKLGFLHTTSKVVFTNTAKFRSGIPDKIEFYSDYFRLEDKSVEICQQDRDEFLRLEAIADSHKNLKVRSGKFWRAGPVMEKEQK